MKAEYYETIEKLLLAKEVPHFDWLRLKGNVPNVYQAIIEVAYEYNQSLTEENARMEKERELILQQARVWAQEGKTQRHTVNQVGSLLGGVPDWGKIVQGVEDVIRYKKKYNDLIERVNKAFRFFWAGRSITWDDLYSRVKKIESDIFQDDLKP